MHTKETPPFVRLDELSLNPETVPIYLLDENAYDYRKRMIQELIVQYPGAEQAYNLITESIESMQDENEREHFFCMKCGIFSPI